MIKDEHADPPMEVELATEALSQPQILRQIEDMGNLLGSIGTERVTVEYGWGCKLKPADLWQPVEVDIEGLSKFVADASRSGIYTAGSADLVIRDPQGRFQLLFCHESDIHFKSSDPRMTSRVRDRWRNEGYRILTKNHSGEWREEATDLS